MNDKIIYQSLSEEGILKSIGPFRITYSDKSTSGIIKPNEEIYKPLIYGDRIVYGEKIIKEIEKE